MVKKAIQGQASGGVEASKIKVLELKSFSGTRSIKDLENFLWDIEQYFKASHVSGVEKVTMMCMYLKGDAKLRWCNRLEYNSSSGFPQTVMWETMRKELKSQFLPCNNIMGCYPLKNVKYTGSSWDYVKVFTSL